MLGSGAFNAGTLTFDSAGSVSISEDSSLDLVGTNTAGSANLGSTAGVSDAGATSVSVTGLLDVTGTTIVLGSGTFNAGSLTFNSAGSVNVAEDSSMLITGSSSAGAGLDLVSASDVTLDASVTVVGNTSITAGTTVGSIDVNAKLNGSGTILLTAAHQVRIEADVKNNSGTLTKAFYDTPFLEAVEQPPDQEITSGNPTARIDVSVAEGTLVAVAIDWQELLDTEPDYELIETGSNRLVSAPHDYNEPSVDKDNEVVIEVIINAFAPETPGGAGTILIKENGKDVLTQEERFKTTVSITVSADLTGGVVMLPTRREIDFSRNPEPRLTALPVVIQQNDITTNREYAQSVSRDTGAEYERYFTLLAEGLSKEFKLEKSFSPRTENSNEPFDINELPILFGRLPDNRYKLLLYDGQFKQTVMEFTIKDGKPINEPSSSDTDSSKSLNEDGFQEPTEQNTNDVAVSKNLHRKEKKDSDDKVQFGSPDTTASPEIGLPIEAEFSDQPPNANGKKRKGRTPTT